MAPRYRVTIERIPDDDDGEVVDAAQVTPVPDEPEPDNNLSYYEALAQNLMDNGG